MKKVISVLLTLTLVIGLMIPSFAKEDSDIVVASGVEEVANLVECEYPIIFVTGIGQTWTHLVNEDGSYKTNADGNIIEYNLLYADLDALLSSPAGLFRALKVVAQLLATIFTDKNHLDKEDVGAVIAKVLRCNLIDENGNLPADVEDTVKKYPLSEYNEMHEGNFYRSIPCQEVVEKVGAENIFCYNYPAFSFIYDNADGLNEFITETVLGKYSDADKVVLVPMSMGASVVSAYLDRYGDSNDVARIVSIVGAWDGSDVIADLIETKYADNSAEMFYDGTLATLLADMFGVDENNKSLVVMLLDVALRVLSKQTLRDLIDTILSGLVDDFLLKTPSLLALIPYDRYEAIEAKYLSDPELAYIKTQLREYHETQGTLTERLARLEKEYGLEVYFICGYGLTFGAGTPDYEIFKFLYSAAKTNSDEIIQISSTAPGATFVVPGEKLENINPDNKYVSPDGSVDLSTAYAPDRTWCFYEQKHELELNNTAINLAFALAIGEFDSIDDCSEKYPQFNESRNFYDIVKGPQYLKVALEYIENNKDDSSKDENVKLVQDALDKFYAMKETTINDRDKDDAVIENLANALKAVGAIETDDITEPSEYMKLVNHIAVLLDGKLFEIFGTGGFKEALAK